MWEKLKSVVGKFDKNQTAKQFTPEQEAFYREYQRHLEYLEKCKESIAYEHTMDWLRELHRDRSGEIAGVLMDRGLEHRSDAYGKEFDAMWDSMESKNPLPRRPWKATSLELEKDKGDMEPEI